MHVEFMIRHCKPFDMLQELTAVVAVELQVTPGTNVQEAMSGVDSEQQAAHRRALSIEAGDFKKADLTFTTRM